MTVAARLHGAGRMQGPPQVHGTTLTGRCRTGKTSGLKTKPGEGTGGKSTCSVQPDSKAPHSWGTQQSTPEGRGPGVVIIGPRTSADPEAPQNVIKMPPGRLDHF